MTAPVNSRTAPAPRDPAHDEFREPLELAQPNAEATSPRSQRVERRFAELEAQLARQLRNSPSIIGGEQDERPARPARRRPRSRRAEELEELLNQLQELAEGESSLAPGEHVLAEEALDAAEALDAEEERAPAYVRREHARKREAVRAPLGAQARIQPETVPWIEPPERTSVFVRATRFAAIIFSVIALAGVSALLVLLAIGDGWQVADVPKDTDRLEQTAAVSSTAEAQPAEDEETTEVASLAKRDTSRIEPDAPAPALNAGRANTATAGIGGQLSPTQEAGRVVGRTAPVTNAPAAAAAPTADESRIAPPPAWSPPANGSETAAGEESSAEPQMEVAPPETNVAAFGGASAPSVPATPAAPAEPMRTAAVKQHVNMRAGPDNEANVVTIVPQGRQVEVVDCDRWCEVVYDGKQGFIHRRFVQGMGG